MIAAYHSCHKDIHFYLLFHFLIYCYQGSKATETCTKFHKQRGNMNFCMTCHLALLTCAQGSLTSRQRVTDAAAPVTEHQAEKVTSGDHSLSHSLLRDFNCSSFTL